jgi:glycosyltransferase involved in cell wall biosynthesis
VPYGKPEAFAKAIVRIIQETFLRERLENGAVSWARNFTWDGSADEFLDYIHIVIMKYPQLPLRRSVTYEIAR